MALFKSVEIDTLKLRTLLVSAPNNSNIPLNHILYSKGDGTTYWSTSINQTDYLRLSAQVSTNTNNIEILKNSTELRTELISTLYGFSTFANNLSTYSTTIFYVDTELDNYSTNIGTHLEQEYTLLSSTNTIFVTLSDKITDVRSTHISYINTLSTVDSNSESRINTLSTNIANISTYTGLKIQTIDSQIEIISTNVQNNNQTERHITNSTISTEIVDLTKKLKNEISTLSSNINTTNSNVSSISSFLNLKINDKYNSSIIYTNQSISSLFVSTLYLISTNVSTINTQITTSAITILSTVNGIRSENMSSISTVAGNNQSTIIYVINQLSTLVKTGVIAEIYDSFNDLVEFSETFIRSSVSNINSTLISSLLYYSTAFMGINRSTYNYIINELYNPGLSTINAIWKSTIEGKVLWNETEGAKITIHKTYALSTLTNVSTITGLSSLTASIINLDFRRSTSNFSILVSDISSEVYYGLIYTPDITNKNKDITVKIDVPSSYANKFINIDTGNLARWLNTAKIYNQSEYGLSKKPVQNIYLSSFIGRQIVQMRYLEDGLYVKDILTYPYIYTTLNLITNINTISTNLFVPTKQDGNVQVSSGYTAMQTSTFVYRNTQIPLSWSTNDPNLKVGVKFMGKDKLGKDIINWSGPYNPLHDSTGKTLVNIPSKSDFVVYDTIEIGVYPNDGLYNTSDSANLNTNGQVFAVEKLSKPIHVITPTINSLITIKNPGDLDKILHVSEIKIYNDRNEDFLSDSKNKYGVFKLKASTPYNDDCTTWDVDNINDGNIFTGYRCGNDACIVDRDAFISVEMSSISNIYKPETAISSILLIGSQNNNMKFTIAGMQLRTENKNQPGIPNGLFYSTRILTSYTPNIINY
jgi:hypothetical protein